MYDYCICFVEDAANRILAEKLISEISAYTLPKKLHDNVEEAQYKNGCLLPLTYDARLTDQQLSILSFCRWLLVLCSKKNRDSPGVRQTIKYFAANRGKEFILPVLTDGEPESSFPPEFFEKRKTIITFNDGTNHEVIEIVEPLAIDVRARDIKSSLQLLRHARIKIVAALIGVSYDTLVQRHERRILRKKVHTLLETFKPPRRCKEADIKRVFRDDAELPAAGVLSDTIYMALKSSRILLVICSKDTPESQWVDKEVRTFIELGRSDRIFALLIDDVPDMCFPPSLKLVPGIETRTLSVKYTVQGFSLKKLKEELIKVIAAATGTQYERLRFALRRRTLARSIFAGQMLTVLLVAAGLYSLYQWVTASYYFAYTQREEILIKDIINDINNNLISAAKNIPKAAPALVKIISDNNMYLDRMMAIGGSTEKNIEAKARNYLNLARAYMIAGDTKETLNASKEAIKIYEALAENSNDEKKNSDLATCYNLTGLYMQYLTEYERAVYYLGKAADVYSKLEKTFDNDEYVGSLADCYDSMGVCYYLLKNYRKAADSFVKEINVRKKMTYDMSLTENQTLFATLYADAASCYNSASENKKAADFYKQAVELYKELYKNSNEPELHKSYVVSLYNLGINSAYEKDNAEAEYYIRLSIAEADKLVKGSMPEYDPYYLSMYAMYDLLYAPDQKKEEALNMVSIAYKNNPTDSFIRHIYAYCLLFNDYFDEASDILNTLIDEDNSTIQKIKNDLDLFIIRGHPADPLLRLMESLRRQ